MYFCDIMKYYERIVENEIKSKLTDESIVDIIGPRECGKTTVAGMFANSTLSFNKNLESSRKLAEFKPELLLKGNKPLLIDDIEKLPVLKDVMVTSSKKIANNGLYITTNSKTPTQPVLMLPMSLYESGDSTGAVKILDLFKNPELPIDGIESKLELDELIAVTCRSGFPRAINNPDEIHEYVKRVMRDYVQDVNGIRRDFLKVQMILQTYSKYVSTVEKNTRLLETCQSLCPTIAKSTLYAYLNDFRQMHVIREIPSWNIPVKSRTSIKTANKKAFCDPAIPAAVLNLTPDDLLFDLEYYEMLFKNLCVRDLQVYTSIAGGRIYHYSDRYDVNVDCVLELSNRDYALINFNLSSHTLDDSIKNLKNVEKAILRKIEAGKLSINPPRFLAIITASHFAYAHKKGVKIIPIGVLR